MASHARDTGVGGDGRLFAGSREFAVTALATGHLGGPGAHGVVAMTGVAIGSAHLLAGGIDAAVGAGLILLLFRQMAIPTESGHFRGGGNLVRRHITNRGAVLFGRPMADAAIEAGSGMAVGFEVRDGFRMAGRTAVRRFLRKDG